MVVKAQEIQKRQPEASAAEARAHPLAAATPASKEPDAAGRNGEETVKKTRNNENILTAVRSGCGVAQGCPIATFGACFPMHTCLHHVHMEFPTVGIVAVADDAYYTGPVDVIYEAFDRIRGMQLAEFNLRSNMGKVKVINPLGATASIPPALLEAQGGELQGF
jgi:hypothetical protein